LRENKIILIFQENCIECGKRGIIKKHAFNKKEDLAASGESQEHACTSEEDDIARNIPFSCIIIQETGQITSKQNHHFADMTRDHEISYQDTIETNHRERNDTLFECDEKNKEFVSK
jgi:hypothetical protein